MAENDPSDVQRQSSLWAPSLRTTLTALAIIIIIVFLFVSFGWNPWRGLAAAAAGGVGGAMGAFVGFFVKLASSEANGNNSNGSLFTTLGVIAGFLAEKIVDKGASTGVGYLLSDDFMGMAVPGMIVGTLCGLAPQLLVKPKYSTFGNASYWLCMLAGFIGGAVLAVPAAAILYFLGRSRASGTSH